MIKQKLSNSYISFSSQQTFTVNSNLNFHTYGFPICLGAQKIIIKNLYMSVGKKEGNILETGKKAKKSPKIWIILIALGVIFLISLNIYYCYEVDILRSKVWQLGRYQTELQDRIYRQESNFHIEIDGMRKRLQMTEKDDKVSWKHLNDDLNLMDQRIDILEVENLKLKTKIKELKEGKIPGLTEYLAELQENYDF